MANTLSYIVLALALGCGGNSSDRDRNNPYQDMNPMYDSSSGKNNNRDSGRHPYDSGLEGRLDAGVDDLGREQDMGIDTGNGTNGAPTLRMVYEESHPLAGETYTERNVRRMRDTPLIGETSDPDSDSVDCRFESGGVLRDWDPDCRYMYNSGVSGEYTLEVRTRDSRGLEGEFRTVSLRVMNNIPPVARIACDEVGDDGLCVYRLDQWEEHCWDGSESYDEDGGIQLYRLHGNLDGPLTISDVSPVICGGYPEVGTFYGRYSVQDDDGEWSSVDFRSIVE